MDTTTMRAPSTDTAKNQAFLAALREFSKKLNAAGRTLLRMGVFLFTRARINRIMNAIYGDCLSASPEHEGDSATEIHPSPTREGYLAIYHEQQRRPFSPAIPLSEWDKGKWLGYGSFVQVFKGFNSKSGEMCAIKEVIDVYISDTPSSRECLNQLKQEVTLFSRLSHPNIVRYFGSKMVGNNLSIYMEYVPGGSIRSLLEEHGRFSESVIRKFTKQILTGLVFLHRNKIVHQDIKGANILMGPNGRVKLADFGLAKYASAECLERSQRKTPRWLAPELVKKKGFEYTYKVDRHKYSYKVDIWSLGCVVIEMAFVEMPWIRYGGIVNDEQLRGPLSEVAKDFIRQCLQRNPSARPTALQLLRHPFLCNC